MKRLSEGKKKKERRKESTQSSLSTREKKGQVRHNIPFGSAKSLGAFARGEKKKEGRKKGTLRVPLL